MANIRKSFNFRSGLQVDNDNFVINANGLVGIGTSVPQTYLLNVYGDTRTTGLTTTRDLFVTQNAEISGVTTVGVLTASSIDVANGIKVGGALTAATLKLANGDTVDNLIGFARTTFITDGVGIHTVSKIGIGTTSNVNYQLDVLGDTRVTGIVSATNFIGILTGTASNASGATGDFSIADKIIHTGDTDTTIRFPAADTFTVETAGTERLRITGIGSVGIGTDNPAQKLEIYGGARITSTDGSHAIHFYPDVTGLGFQRIISYNTTSFEYEDLSIGVNDFIVTNGVTAERLRITSAGNVGIGSTIPTSKLDVSGDAKVSGVITATTFVGNLTGGVTGVVNASSGVSTFTELKVGTAITMSAGIITATTFEGALNSTNLTGTINNDRLPDLITSNINASSGVSTFTELKVGTAITMSAGIITATTFEGALNSTNLTGTINNDRLPVTPQFTSIGIGTASPTDALHIQQSGAAEIYVGSDSAASSLRVGRNLDDNDSGMVKYGNTTGIYPYSTEKSLDFMNFGQGNVNFYIEAGITTTSDFNFNWNKGGNTNLMTLTKGGNLGIGITNPTHKLNVQGISTFTDNAHFNSNVTIDGSLNFSAGANITATLIGDVQNSSSNVILDVSVPRVNANVFIQTGISTFNEVSIGSTSKSENVVIGGGNVVRTDLEDVITANSETNRFFVNSSGSIGIKTTISYGLDIGVNCTTKQALFSGVGIGTTSMRCAVDFADAGTLGVTTHTYLVPPKVSTSNRNGIAGTITGATIYNITDNKLQVYTGSTWETITSS